MASSPQKFVEKISAELKGERGKANNALQDNANLRIELSNLSNKIYDQDATINQLQSSLDDSTQRLNEAINEVDHYQQLERELRDELEYKKSDIAALVDERTRFHGQIEDLERQLEQRAQDAAAAGEKMSKLEGWLHAKEEMAVRLGGEIQQIRTAHSETEHKYLDCYQALQETTAVCEEQRERIGYLSVVEASYEDLKATSGDLRAEYEATLRRNELLNVDLRIMAQKLEEGAVHIATLEEGGATLLADRDQLQQRMASLQEDFDRQSQRIDAEVRAGVAAREEAESAQQGREQLTLQVQEVRRAHQEALQRNTELEGKLSQSNNVIAELQAELTDGKDRILELSGALDRAAEAERVAAEVGTLRDQLQDMKRQLARRDVEDGAGTVQSQALLDREANNRRVYEELLDDLRADVERLTSANYDLRQQFEAARIRASRVERLEEQIEVYKEISVAISNEKQNALFATVDAQERSLKASQEINSIRHELHRVETELGSSRLEVEELARGNRELRETMKELTADRIAADRKTAEAQEARSKLAIGMEDLRQRSEATTISLDKSQQTVHDLRMQIADLQVKEKRLGVLEGQHASLNSALLSTRTTSTARERELTLEVEHLRHTRETQQKELDAYAAKSGIQRKHVESLEAEVAALRAEIENMAAERERAKRESSKAEAVRAEQQLAELRKDLETTVSEWQGLEREKGAKDRLVAQLQGELGQEKGKTALLKMQLHTLEDRMRVANQELSVFRSLDVYHSSMQVELQSYRKDRSASLNQSAVAPHAEYSFHGAGLDSLLLSGVKPAPPTAERKIDHPSAPVGGTAASHASQSAMHPVQRSSLDSYAATDLFRSRAAQPTSASRRHGDSDGEEADEDRRSVVSDLGSRFDLPLDSDRHAHTPAHDRGTGYGGAQPRSTRDLPAAEFKESRPVPHHHDASQQQRYATGSSSVASSVQSEEERDRGALLQSRQERKAAREQQLRDKILRESAASGGVDRFRASSGGVASGREPPSSGSARRETPGQTRQSRDDYESEHSQQSWRGTAASAPRTQPRLPHHIDVATPAPSGRVSVDRDRVSAQQRPPPPQPASASATPKTNHYSTTAQSSTAAVATSVIRGSASVDAASRKAAFEKARKIFAK